MTPFMTFLVIWIAFAPLGYISARWVNRVLGWSWTNNDRLSVIFLSLLNGPGMPLFAVAMFIIERLGSSAWGKKDARW